MTFNIKCKAKRMTAKQQHRLFQFFQPDIDLRRFAHFTAQSLKFEELEKKEKEPIRREYYHKLNRLKQEKAYLCCRRYVHKRDKDYKGEIKIIRVDKAGGIVYQKITNNSKPLQQ